MVEVSPVRRREDDDGGMTNLAGIADEDFKAVGESSAPTEESAPENPNDKSFDSDAILDDPASIDVLGEKKDVSHEPGKVTKEIIEMGEGKRKPMLGWLCKIKYIAYFYDKNIFDTSPQNGEGTVELFIGDITWPEGLWKGMQDMRKNERAKIRI